MAKSTTFLMASLASLLLLTAAAAPLEVPLSWELGIPAAAGDDGEELVVRRMLQGSPQYISYGALQRNSVPCSQRGASYYNCRPGAQANPYNRGCSAITRCRG